MKNETKLMRRCSLPEALSKSFIYGAIFQDSGFSLEHTQRIFDDRIVPFTEKHCKSPSATDSSSKGLVD